MVLENEGTGQTALDAVMNDDILLTPAKYKNTYRYWMENVKDWCISRQLWWGHQIPVYYLPDSNDYVVAENIAEAVRLVKEKFGKDIPAGQLRQDEDCLALGSHLGCGRFPYSTGYWNRTMKKSTITTRQTTWYPLRIFYSSGWQE